ncbi:MAG: FkbM family methyltransferase [Terriglobales bacterium]
MPLLDSAKALLDRPALRPFLIPLASSLARAQKKGVRRILCDDGIWIHETTRGYFAYHQPFLRLDMARMDESARTNFLWGYQPQPGHVVIDVGAGVGEEALTFSRALGPAGKLVCIEAHPRTCRCLEMLVRYNRLANVIPMHWAVADAPSAMVIIQDSRSYVANRLNPAKGIPVPATTIDAIHRKLGLGRVHFLKMNIEGAERFAIRGMSETLKQTEVLCVSCHDSLAEATGDDTLRTKSQVRQFFQQNGIEIRERIDPSLPPYIRDQLWGYNQQLLQMKTKTAS